MEMAVGPSTISDILQHLRRGAWLVPLFQRDFVWTVQAVKDFADSIVKTRPVGMITLWAQADDAALPLEPLSVPDIGADNTSSEIKFMVDQGTRTQKYYAILDGKQRCTALALVFAGLRPENRRAKLAGRFFFDVTVNEDENPVTFLKDAEITRRNLKSDAECFAKGLFPFTSSKQNESLSWQWIRYVQEVRNANNYGQGAIPSEGELARRERLLKEAYDGINNTRFAVLTVPDNYRLDEICEIFDKLNTTGTKVSTVDLIHSWLYAETAGSSNLISLRDWMVSIRERDGAIGWIDPESRPELSAQLATAAYVALDSKPAARSAGGASRRQVTSIKAADLLATPSEHWRSVVANEDSVCAFLSDMQTVVAGAAFPWTAAPYPAAATIYFGLRWHQLFEPNPDRTWTTQDLNAVFKAFFWRNALATRYDQGFLSQVGSDMSTIRKWLDSKRAGHESEWRAMVCTRLEELIPSTDFPRARLIKLLTGGKLSGALQKALTLPLIAGVKRDLLDQNIRLGYPDAQEPEMHHIFPLGWCNSNQHGALLEYLDPEQSGADYARSVANLVPLSRKSNNEWKAKVPGQALLERSISFDQVAPLLTACFIDREAYGYLVAKQPDPGAFWERRAQLFADHLLALTTF